MDFILLIKILFLSFIQAFTEFLPISSTAHLLLFGHFVNFNLNDGGLFMTIIQLATSLAVLFLYRKKLFGVLFTFFTKKESRKFCFNIAIAIIPAIVLGLLMYSLIKTYFSSPLIIAISLIIGGIIMLVVENKQKNIKTKYENVDDLDFFTSFKIGLCQALAIIPGVSRSGSTIIGGLINKLNRKTAVEFSFFLSIPTIFLASCYDFYKTFSLLNKNNIYNILLGFIITFIFTIPIIKGFITFISKKDFKFFGYYRIVVGIIILIMYGVINYVKFNI